MKREIFAVLAAALLLIGAGAAQSSWYPRSQDYATSGGFVGSFFNVTGDGNIGGNLTVGGTITGDMSNESHPDSGYDPDMSGWTIYGFIDVYGWGIVDDFTAWYSFLSRGPATFQGNATFEDDVFMETDLYVTGTIDQIGDLGDLNNGETTIVEALNATDERLDVIETDFPLNVSRIEDLEGDVGDVTNMTAPGGDIASALDRLDTRATDLETDVGDVTNMTTAGDNLADGLDRVGSRAGDLETDVGDMANVTTTAKTAAGAIDELDSDIGGLTSRVGVLEMPPIWHVQVITAPAAATSDEVLNATDGAITTEGTDIDEASMTGVIDVARCLILTPNDSMTGDVLLTGTDIEDAEITETIAWDANATATTTAQAFKTLAWANFTTNTNTSVTIDYSDKLGLAVIPDDEDAVMFAFLGGVMEMTLPTVTIGATVAECLADLDSALTGADDVKVYVYEAV